MIVCLVEPVLMLTAWLGIVFLALKAVTQILLRLHSAISVQMGLSIVLKEALFYLTARAAIQGITH
jgi:hypothetical protein